MVDIMNNNHVMFQATNSLEHMVNNNFIGVPDGRRVTYALHNSVEESIWSGITNPFSDSPKETHP